MPLKRMSKYINEPNTFASLVFQGKLHQSRSYMQNARLSGIKANLFKGKDVGGRQIQQQLCVRSLCKTLPTPWILCASLEHMSKLFFPPERKESSKPFYGNEKHIRLGVSCSFFLNLESIMIKIQCLMELRSHEWSSAKGLTYLDLMFSEGSIKVQ